MGVGPRLKLVLVVGLAGLDRIEFLGGTARLAFFIHNLYYSTQDGVLGFWGFGVLGTDQWLLRADGDLV